MYTIIFSLLLDVRANQSGGTWVPWSIDSFEKYTRTLYHICIISSHVRYILWFSFGCSGEPAGGTWVPWSIDSFENIHSCTLYNICKYHLMYAIICYFLLDVRANQSGGTWVPWSIDSFGVRIHQLSVIFFWRYVSSLKYRFLWKIHSYTLYNNA